MASRSLVGRNIAPWPLVADGGHRPVRLYERRVGQAGWSARSPLCLRSVRIRMLRRCSERW